MKKRILTLLAYTLTAASLFAAPKAVVFDFGGVMTGEPNRQAVVQFIRESLDLTEADFEAAQKEKRKFIANGKTDAEYWTAFAKTKGISLPANWVESLHGTMKSAINVNDEMYQLVEQLQAQKIPTGMLSNIDERLAAFVRKFGLYAPFEPCLLSYEIGVEKPNLKAYTILIEQLNMPANDIVFIDDRPENVEAAIQAGLDAIVFESASQIKGELTKRGAFTR